MLFSENLDDFGNVACVDLAIPLKMKVNSVDKKIVEVFQLKMKQLGFNLELIAEKNGEGECQNWSILINKIPKIFAKRFYKDDNLLTNLNSLIHNLLRVSYYLFIFFIMHIKT
jgi:hypothetical protein